MKAYKLLFLSILLIISCVNVSDNLTVPRIEESVEGIITQSEALKTLDEFLSETGMHKTKAGEIRTYSKVEPHFPDFKTKGNDCNPDAYLVNFDNNQGFAILGAKTSVAPIIAVVEQGNTDWERLLPIQKLESLLMKSSKEEVDSDILGKGMTSEEIMTSCVIGALYGDTEVEYEDTKAGYTTNLGPLMGNNYQFGQNVTYCHKGSNRFVTNGCASTAISMILAYNSYPPMVVDACHIDYTKCDTNDGMGYFFKFSDDRVFIKPEDYFKNAWLIPSALSDSQQLSLLNKVDANVISDHGTPSTYGMQPFYRTRYRLTSGVYYMLNCVINNWNGTGTMPDAAVSGLTDLGYTNVKKTKEKSLSSNQITTIISMLNNNKPVLMCGWSLFSLSSSHYWVVDGIRQNSSGTLICCNWGHSGYCDGWFSSDCIREETPIATKSAKKTGNGWNNIIVFSYDIPSTSTAVDIHDFFDNHRVTY